MAKKENGQRSPPGSGKIGRDSVTGQFVDRAEKWAAANTTSRQAAGEKLKEMGIYDRNGKLAKDYR